jgi:mono/diheme cytochrome c family protein
VAALLLLQQESAMRNAVRLSLLAYAIAILFIIPLSCSPPQAASPDGERLYADYCSSCHGEEFRNTSSGVTFDLRRLKPADHDRFLNAVLNGKNQMPPWRGALEPEQIEAIWAYLRATVDK